MSPTVLPGGHRGPVIAVGVLALSTAVVLLVSRAAPLLGGVLAIAALSALSVDDPGAPVSGAPPGSQGSGAVVASIGAGLTAVLWRLRRRATSADSARPHLPGASAISAADLDLLVDAARHRGPIETSLRPRWVTRLEESAGPEPDSTGGEDDDWDAGPSLVESARGG